MSNQAFDCCRLCSTSRNLISMFSGKSRTIRDYLRKMIQETVHIRIERNDSVPSVCFNCLVDISNFYYFKLHCLLTQNKLKDIEVGFSQRKKIKLAIVTVEEIQKPDIDSTQEVLNWLTSKRANILEFEEKTKILNKYSQTYQESFDTFTQYEIVNTFSQGSQTSDMDSARVQPLKSHNKSTQVNNSATYGYSESKSSNKKNKPSKIKTKNGYSQTDKNTKTCDLKDSFSQTERKILSQKIFVEDLVSEIPVEKHFQSELVDKFGTNGHKTGLQVNEVVKIIPENKIIHTTGTSQYKDNFQDKNCQTDISVNTQCESLNMLNGFYGKDYILPSTSFTHSRQVDSKLNIKICFKEEKLSPLECQTVITTPEIFEPLSPNSSDLLQVKPNKSDCVQICKICDKTLYNKKEITLHSKSHMQCQFCKKKFKSLKSTQSHVHSCKVKQLNILPFIDLERIDKQPDIIAKYPEVFNASSM